MEKVKKIIKYFIDNNNKFKQGLGTKNYKRLLNISFILVLTVIICTSTVVFAEDDPLAVVNNLSDFIFSLVKLIGYIILGFGIIQFGLAIKGHDPAQRANAVLTIAGGIIIRYSREILDFITR